MTDYFQDRIPLNQAPSMQAGAGSHGSLELSGSLDQKPSGNMNAVVMDKTVAKEKPAPTNPPHTWSADSPYKGLVS